MSVNKPRLLTDIWENKNPQEYKVHFATHNGEEDPLDVFVRDRKEWHGWQVSWSNGRWENCEFIFSMMRFYPEGKTTWLFGGIFEITARHPNRCYEVAPTDQGEAFIGRSKLRSAYIPQQPYPWLETVEDNPDYQFEVREILSTPYSG